MQHLTAAALAFALGASARPQWPSMPYPDCGGSQPSASGIPLPVSSVAPTGGIPSYSVPPVSLPAPTGGSSAAPVYSAPSYVYSNSSVEYSVPAAPSSAPAGSGYMPSGVASSTGAVTGSPSIASSNFESGGGMPASSGTSVLSAAQTIAAGDSFDCGMVAYDRGASCTGQEEGGDSDAVFILEEGASLSNCIIGPNQIEGVHCFGGCSLTNVWWPAVCEDAFTIKEQDAGSTTTVSGGGAFGADDKVLQHNGGGTLSVSGFTVDDFGKVYRSCGNCDDMYERHVIFDDITASGGSTIAGINSNYGDTATFSNIKVSDVSEICVTYTGNDSGDEPEENGSGPSESCMYDESDITES